MTTPGGHRGAFVTLPIGSGGGGWSPSLSNTSSHPTVLLSAPQGSSHPSVLSSFHLGQIPPTPGHGPCCSHCLEHCSLSFFPCHIWTPCNPPGKLLPDGHILLSSTQVGAEMCSYGSQVFLSPQHTVSSSAAGTSPALLTSVGIPGSSNQHRTQ